MVLGAIMLSQSCISSIELRGGVNLFHDPVHTRVYEVAREKDRAGELVSPITMRTAFENDDGFKELGGPEYLVRLAGAAPSQASLQGYADLLREMRARRQITSVIREAQEAIAEGRDAAASIARKVEAGLLTIEAPDAAERPVSMLAAVTKAMTMANAAYQGADDGAVRSGFTALDRLVSGFYPGELTLIGGRPSMGKTAVALSIALNTARAGHGVVIASLEMNPEAMAIRAISEATAQAGRGVSYASIRRGSMAEEEFRHALDVSREVAEMPIYFLPRHFSDMGAMISGVRQAKRAMGDNMRLVVVDYAQLLKSQARTRYEQITEISIALKNMAGALNVPVIALSQLSRTVEQRGDKRPMLSDLRESGQLEQDADAVIFCYRDEYYLDRERPDANDQEAMADWQAARGRVQSHLELIVAKQRQGEIGTAHLRFNPATNIVWEESR